MDILRVCNLRFAWPAWHFVTCGRVWQRVENRFSWKAQYFCNVFKRCVTFFVAGAALWTCPNSIFHGRRSTSDVSCSVFFVDRIGTAARSGTHVQIPWQAWHFVTRVKIGGSLARNACFEVSTCVLACLCMRSNYGEAAMPYV